MSRIKLFFFILLSFSIVSFLFILTSDIYQKQDHKPLGTSNVKSAKGYHKIKFFDEQLFNKAVIDQDKLINDAGYHISGAIIPHDLLPSFIFADLFSKLATQNPKTIILIGPNHYEKGNHKFLTSLFDWETPFGNISADQVTIQELIENSSVGINEEALSNDHSVMSSMPFMKYYLPDTKIVPILVSGYTNIKEAEVFANYLSRIVNEDTVLIAAVDFSHYLNTEEAKEKDEVTLEVLKNYDYRQLFALNNDYTDSPASLGVLIMTMQKLGMTNLNILNNTNSGILQNEDYIETTSYFYITYH